ncbi:MAG TPA: hypothetical protein VEJ63_17100 [Planctomycetota bacterium]|nr:hypothetical protein [Planctomycetota bacterium]
MNKADPDFGEMRVGGYVRGDLEAFIDLMSLSRNLATIGSSAPPTT